MVIVDRATGTRATSQPEPEGQPLRFGGLVDGPVSWGGLRWFGFPLYMLPENDADVRQQVMLHGLFHRIQPELGLITDDGFNEHLDTLEGRFWIQLEWRALRRAVESTGSDRAEAIADALAFRRERRRPFPAAADNERRDEIREGLVTGHAEPRLGGAASGTTWLLYYRSRDLILCWCSPSETCEDTLRDHTMAARGQHDDESN